MLIILINLKKEKARIFQIHCKMDCFFNTLNFYHIDTIILLHDKKILIIVVLKITERCLFIFPLLLS